MIINYKDTDLGIPYDKEPVKNILWGVLLFAEDKIIIMDQGLIVDMTIGGSRRGGADCGL